MMIKRPQLTLPARTVSLAAIPGVSLDLEAPETAREDRAFRVKATERFLIFSVPSQIDFMAILKAARDTGLPYLETVEQEPWKEDLSSGIEKSLQLPAGELRLEAEGKLGSKAERKVIILSTAGIFFEYVNYPAGYFTAIAFNTYLAQDPQEGLWLMGPARTATGYGELYFPLNTPTWVNGAFFNPTWGLTAGEFLKRTVQLRFGILKKPSTRLYERMVTINLKTPGLAPLVRYEIDIEAGTLTQKANLQ